jgi:hypothetical protein
MVNRAATSGEAVLPRTSSASFADGDERTGSAVLIVRSIQDVQEGPQNHY